MIDLTNHVALVTGSSRGIGAACAVRLAEAGADIVVNYLTSRTAAQDVAHRIQGLGRRAAVVKADVSEQEDVDAMIGFVKETFGGLDILVCNAATGGFRPVLDTNTRHFEAAFNTNVRSLLFLVQSALPLLDRAAPAQATPDRVKRRAKVIALSSHGSHLAQPKYGLIGSTKAALESLVRHLALEIGDRGINLNVVLAGLVETDSFRQMPEGEKLLAHRRSKSMVGERGLTVEDVADAVLFLASPLSDTVQGHTLVVDGGTGIRS
jgi:enoyl-[acyl-carrier protein] reductase III